MYTHVHVHAYMYVRTVYYGVKLYNWASGTYFGTCAHVLCNRKFTQEWNADFVWYWPRTLRIILRNSRVCSCRAHWQWQGMPGSGDGETLVNKVKSIGGAAYAKAEVLINASFSDSSAEIDYSRRFYSLLGDERQCACEEISTPMRAPLAAFAQLARGYPRYFPRTLLPLYKKHPALASILIL